MKFKSLIFCLVLSVLSSSIFSIEIGVLAGTTVKKPSINSYGLSASMGFFLPLVKFDVEFTKIADTKYKSLAAGIKFRPKFGRFALFVIIGAGTEFTKFDFDFSEYNGFLFLGGGGYIFFNEFISLRLGMRSLSFSKDTRTRIAAGLFIHI